MLSLKSFGQDFSFEGAMPESAQNLTKFKISKTKNIIFEYFPNISSEINSTHPFHPILIPFTFTGSLRGPKNQQ